VPILEQSYLRFWLYKYEQPEGALKVIPFDSNSVNTILFELRSPGDYNFKKCALNDIEELSHEDFRQWNSVLKYIDDPGLVGRNVNDRYEGMLTLKVS
jgi:hypothetical protein